MIKFDVNTSGISDIRMKLAGAASKAEVWLANEVLKDTRPFVPALTMSLANRSHVEGNTVVYPGPYARYLYYGKVMAGPREGPKYATDKDLVYTKTVNAQAQSHWFEASKAQNKGKWIRGVKKLAKSEI